MAKLSLLPILAIIAALAAASALAHAEKNFTETKELIDSGVSCDELTDGQLEEIGEYYMEQMHPGAAHELMDEMMGGEGSESLKQMHIQMAKRLYCKEDVGGVMGLMGSGGMMNMMMGNNMMGSGMMGAYYGAGSLAGVLWLIILILLVVALSLSIIWLYKQINRKK
ncbi:hypothetical protein HYU40_02750 [Candidatus Woesearchaeota archaeon]|nr:hypothetical protein [Candidatus Woesearchaeota archaeon]